MLEGVDPLLGPKRLKVPADRGHDDALVSAGTHLRHGLREGQTEALERDAFGEGADKAPAIVVTGEPEPGGIFRGFCCAKACWLAPCGPDPSSR